MSGAVVTPSPLRTAFLTLLTLVAFAANSLLCRMALAPPRAIDPTTFTALRLASGAALLLPLAALWREPPAPSVQRRALWSGVALFAYAIAFSWAYVTLSTGTGALVLFGAVQATMIGVGLWRGERPPLSEWLGFSAAVGGLVYLVFPGLAAPDPLGMLSMAIAGIAWGVYSLRGRGSSAPVRATQRNFLFAAPLGGLALLVALSSAQVSPRGVLLAVTSGAITSGVGYVLWYAALRGLTATRAALVQLAVPVIAAVGGVLVLGERVTLRLVVASVLILGGVGGAVLFRAQRS